MFTFSFNSLLFVLVSFTHSCKFHANKLLSITIYNLTSVPPFTCLTSVSSNEELLDFSAQDLLQL